jgi:Tol biopolymer transport system component
VKLRVGIIVAIGVFMVGVGLLIYAWKTQPELFEVYPQDGAINIQATTPIRLVFSQPMKAESVNSHLKIEPTIQGSFSWEGTSLTFTPDQPWPGGQTISIVLGSGARAANWLSFPLKQHIWSFSTASEELAYLWPSDDKADLYVLNPLNGDIQRITQDKGVLEYSASSSGMVFYFSAGNPRGGANLYRVNRAEVFGSADNTYPIEELLDCGAAQCRSPVVSFDDQYLAYEYILPSSSIASAPTQIWMLNLASGQAGPIGLDMHETVQPNWSTIGLLAYYDRTSQGYEVYNPQNQERILLPNRTGQPGIWSPDGAFYLAPEVTITQLSGGGEAGISQLICYDVHSKAAENISGNDFVEDVEPVYADSGSMVIFSRRFLDAQNWSLGRQVWTMKADGSEARKITNEPDYNHYDLAVSLDDRLIAYVRFNQAKLADPPELWMVDMDGSNPVQLVIGGYLPTWIP